MNALLLRVREELERPLDSKLQDLYNTRNAFYGSFRQLAPDNKENLKARFSGNSERLCPFMQTAIPLQ